MRIPKDVVVFPEANDCWVVMNVFARTCLGVESRALTFLKTVDSEETGNLSAKFSEETFQIWEIEWFSNYDGLLADPTRYIREVNDWNEPEIIDAKALVTRFKQHYLLIDNEERYKKSFAPKATILDSEHFGNFHQQLGQHLILNRRESSEKWWINQKFTEDLSSIRGNLYQAIQAQHLINYFPRKFNRGDHIIDIGCGPGFYSNLMAATGASVLGIDPNETYIDIARKNAKENACFEISQIGVSGALDHIPSDSTDFIFMSDALLFYFTPVDPEVELDIQTLFADVRRILKPKGCFISVEPHYIFWLLPWLGDVDRPFTILTEYLHKTFGVTATINQLIQEYAKGGFAITWMEELTPDPDFEKVDPRAYQFAQQFPLWQLFELTPLPQKK